MNTSFKREKFGLSPAELPAYEKHLQRMAENRLLAAWYWQENLIKAIPAINKKLAEIRNGKQ